MAGIFLVIIYVAIVHARFLLLYLLNFFLTPNIFQIISISPLFIFIFKKKHFILTIWKCFLGRLLLCNIIFVLFLSFQLWVLLLVSIVVMMSLIIFTDYNILVYCLFFFNTLTLMCPKLFLQHLLNLQCLSLLLLLMIIHHL